MARSGLATATTLDVAARTRILNGVMLLWFSLTAVAVAFVAIDIRSAPESPVLKWGFILLTTYTRPISALLYVLGCREPLRQFG
jgi:hypothetical protein